MSLKKIEVWKRDDLHPPFVKLFRKIYFFKGWLPLLDWQIYPTFSLTGSLLDLKTSGLVKLTNLTMRIKLCVCLKSYLCSTPEKLVERVTIKWHKRKLQDRSGFQSSDLTSWFVRCSILHPPVHPSTQSTHGTTVRHPI